MDPLRGCASQLYFPKNFDIDKKFKRREKYKSVKILLITAFLSLQPCYHHRRCIKPPSSSHFLFHSTNEGKRPNDPICTSPFKSINFLWENGRKLSISSGLGNAIAALETRLSPSSPQPPPAPVPCISSTHSPCSSTALTPVPSTAPRESVTSQRLEAAISPNKVVVDDPLRYGP